MDVQVTLQVILQKKEFWMIQVMRRKLLYVSVDEESEEVKFKQIRDFE